MARYLSLDSRYPLRYPGYWETKTWTSGYSYKVWKKAMPLIQPNIMNCAIYLYETQEDAERGESSGGSGFIVAVPSNVFPDHISYLYAVTNSHVVSGAPGEGKCHFLRVNTIAGGVDIKEVSDWRHHPDGDDVAIAPIGLDARHRFGCASSDMLLTKDIITEEGIGPGDETFMVGRLISHDGKQRNTPSVRFGNISIMPAEPIPHKTRGIDQESLVVESRSLSGFSGSPVFVYTAPFFSRPNQEGRSGRIMLYLLGIDWCHLPFYQPVLQGDRETKHPDKLFVEVVSGMMGVIPAWKITDLLNAEEAVEARKQQDEELKKKSAGGGIPDLAHIDELTEEGFEETLRKVSQPIKPSEPGPTSSKT